MARASSSRGRQGEAAALVLRGTPDNLVGVLDLANESKEPRVVRSLRLREADIAAVGRAARRRVLLRAAIPAGGRRKVPVEFAVSPTTPPGDYSVVFASDSGDHHARIEVLPQQRLSLLPERIEIQAAPGEVVKVPVVLSNEGNVPLELSALGVMVLEESQQMCLALQHALGAARDKDHKAFLDALVSNLAGKKVDFMRLKLAGAGMTLDVGETQSVELELHVPANAAPGRTYQARTAVFDQPLFVKLRTRGPERPAARKTAARGKGASR
jgi:hypothetical protein